MTKDEIREEILGELRKTIAKSRSEIAKITALKMLAEMEGVSKPEQAKKLTPKIRIHFSLPNEKTPE